MMDFEWISDVVEVIPDKSNYQKSFFDISGFPRWETVNSNLLAFYFNKDEEHNFGTLFIESLLILVNNNNNINYEDNFDVSREVRTQKGNFIDIVIKSTPEENINISDEDEETEDDEQKNSDWAIIIENKIDANLNNNLVEYWKSVNAQNKIGIVLSKNQINLSKFNVKNVQYYSITHKDLIEQIQRNFHGYFSKSNEKHLILLKEYINNIENIYFKNIMEEQYSQILKKFHDYKEEIRAIEKTKIDLIKFVSKETFKVFKEYNFAPNSGKTTSKSKHFYANKDTGDKYKGFRFWVNFNSLIYNNQFRAFFELYNKSNTKFGSKVKETLSKQNVFTNSVSKAGGGSDKTGHNQIYSITIPLNIDGGSNFSEVLSSRLKSEFFGHPNDFLNKAVDAFNQAKAE